jgi:serine/threonine protein kinase
MRKQFIGKKDIYTVKKEFHAGQNGRTYLAIAQQTASEVIVKIPKLDGVNPEDLPERIPLLNSFLEVEASLLSKLRGLRGIAQLLDRGVAYHKGKLGTQLWFNVYEFVPGLNLDEWSKLYAKSLGLSQFKGIRDPLLWLRFATSITGVLADVHSRKVVHGDIDKKNVIAHAANPDLIQLSDHANLVLIDFGWGIALEQHTSVPANRSIWYPHWAPERVKHDDSNPRWYSPADIYSLGNFLLFLAAGDCKIIPFRDEFVKDLKDNKGGYEILNCNQIGESNSTIDIFKSRSELKALVSSEIASRNPELYEGLPFISELIMFCMRPNVTHRARHAGVVQQQLRALSRSITGKTRFSANMLRGFGEKFHSILKRSCQDGVHPMLLKLVHNDLEKVARGLGQSRTVLLNRPGRRDELIIDITSCIGETQKGDVIQGVVALTFFQSNNFGPTGRFMASLATAAHCGVVVQLAILVQNGHESTPAYMELLAELLRRSEHCGDLAGRPAIEAKCRVLEKKEFETFLKHHGSFIMLKTPEGVLRIDADYDRTGGRCTALRFSSRTERSNEIKELNSEFARFYRPSQVPVQRSNKSGPVSSVATKHVNEAGEAPD